VTEERYPPAPFDYTRCSDRNRPHPTKIIEIAGGVKFVVLNITREQGENCRTLLYMHVNRINRKFYIGRTTMLAADRFNLGHGYRLQEAMGAAIKRHGWNAFDTYVLALGDDDASLRELEVQAIKDAGGHKSCNSYNISPGGEIVADTGKPVICVHMPTMKATEYESATACGNKLNIHPDGVAAVARGDINSRGSARRQNIGDYYFYFKGETPHYPDHFGGGARAKRIADKLGRPIVAINYNTGDRKYFRSTGEAAGTLGLHQSAVSQVVLGKTRSAGDWFFYLADQPRELPTARGSVATREKRDVTVYAVDLKTREKTAHRNATVAGQACGISQSSVSAILSGQRGSENGFWFTYDPTEEPPKHYGKASVRFHKEQPVMAIELQTGKRTPFSSATAASKALGVQRSSISLILNPGDPKTIAQGYTFEAIDKAKWEELKAAGKVVE
jgi:hypothetical protein